MAWLYRMGVVAPGPEPEVPQHSAYPARFLRLPLGVPEELPL